MHWLIDSEKAIEYFKKAYNISQYTGDKENQGFWLGNMGRAHLELDKNPNMAIEYFKKALTIAEEINDRTHQGYWLENIGSTYIMIGEYRKALENTREALQIAKQSFGSNHTVVNRLERILITARLKLEGY